MNRCVPLTIGAANGCENFRRWLKSVRLENKDSQEQLGLGIDLERKTITAFELGTVIPKLDHVFRIMEYYDIDEITLSIKENSPIIDTYKPFP